MNHVQKDKSEFWAGGLMFPPFDEHKQQVGFTKVILSANIDIKKMTDDCGATDCLAKPFDIMPWWALLKSILLK